MTFVTFALRPAAAPPALPPLALFALGDTGSCWPRG